ncbi:MAG: hypothetical protein ACI4JM_07650 [Oscillospiraceae bacterium]
MDDIMGKIQEMLSDEESMKQIKELADMLSVSSDDNGSQGNNSSQESANNNASAGFDIGMIFKIQEMMSAAKTDKNTELIKALRLHLSKEKQERADKALKFMKLFSMFETLKESGMLKDLDKML